VQFGKEQSGARTEPGIFIKPKRKSFREQTDRFAQPRADPGRQGKRRRGRLGRYGLRPYHGHEKLDDVEERARAAAGTGIESQRDSEREERYL